MSDIVIVTSYGKESFQSPAESEGKDDADSIHILNDDEVLSNQETETQRYWFFLSLCRQFILSCCFLLHDKDVKFINATLEPDEQAVDRDPNDDQSNDVSDVVETDFKKRKSQLTKLT